MVAQKSKPLPNDKKIVLKPVTEIRFIRQKSMNQALYYSSLSDILYVTYFLTSITITWVYQMRWSYVSQLQTQQVNDVTNYDIEYLIQNYSILMLIL